MASPLNTTPPHINPHHTTPPYYLAVRASTGICTISEYSWYYCAATHTSLLRFISWAIHSNSLITDPILIPPLLSPFEFPIVLMNLPACNLQTPKQSTTRDIGVHQQHTTNHKPPCHTHILHSRINWGGETSLKTHPKVRVTPEALLFFWKHLYRCRKGQYVSIYLYIH